MYTFDYGTNSKKHSLFSATLLKVDNRIQSACKYSPDIDHASSDKMQRVPSSQENQLWQWVSSAVDKRKINQILQEGSAISRAGKFGVINLAEI